MTNVSPPPGWGQDALSHYLQEAYENRYATFANKRREFKKLIDIDACFVTVAGKDWRNSGNLVSAMLFLRAHAAFRAACEHSAAGQVGDVFPALRACLEYAIYALHIHRKPAAAEIWLRRHDDEVAAKACKNEFKIASLRNSLVAANKHAAERFDKLYQDAIDFGAHPNERAITGNLTIIESENEKRFEQIYLHGDGLALDHALKNTARVGLCTLEILECVFQARFELLGVRAAMIELRKGL